MNIVLIGYRGCGKTTVGELLAARWGMGFVDTDDAVVRRCGGMSIKLIWATLGEGKFRAIEARVLEQLLSGDGRVLATGGGAVVSPRGRRIVAEARNAARIYLRADAKTLAERLGGDACRADRPSTGTSRNSIGAIALELGRREPIYREVADHEVDVAARTAEQVAEEIVRRVNRLIG